MPEKIVVSWEFLSPTPVLNGPEIVKWMATASRIEDGLFLVRLIANLAPGYMLVSQRTRPDEWKAPTQLNFKRRHDLKLVGRCTEIGQLVGPLDDGWAVFPDRRGKISYMQKVALSRDLSPEISGFVKYQVCSEAEVFEPKTVHFSILVV